MRLVFFILFLVFELLLLAVLILPFLSLTSDEKLEGKHEQTMYNAGVKANATLDVPVVAALFYGDSIIAWGSNTVRRDRNAGGHAEINAISDALKRFGWEGFRKLHRDSLLLVSSFEPCMMCCGAITEYNIRKVHYINKKELAYVLKKEHWPLLRYFISRRKIESDLQDRLFKEAFQSRQEPQQE